MSAVSNVVNQKSGPPSDGFAAAKVSDQRSAPSGQRQSSDLRPPTSDLCPATPTVSLLTGGSDRPYVLGLVEALTSAKVSVELIGSDELSLPELLSNPRVNFLNLRGDQSSNAPFTDKVLRILKYYWRIIYYAATAKPMK